MHGETIKLNISISIWERSIYNIVTNQHSEKQHINHNEISPTYW